VTIAAALVSPGPPPIPPLDSGLPIVLLPVRLETRFSVVAGGTDLLIRIYPDDVHVDTHEPELTDEEVTWGQNYWQQAWRGGGPGNERERAAWAQLAGRFSPQRAAWIARQLEPRNPTARPSGAVADTRPLTPVPDFPSPPRHATAWTRAPRAALLPDRWIALGYLEGGTRVLTAMGNPVQDPLAVGPQPDPSTAPPAPLTDPTQAIDPGMRWLIDFEAAVQVGMGIRVRVTPSSTVSHDEVARLAYQLWTDRGRPWGSPWSDWFPAEARLKGPDIVGLGGLSRLIVLGVKAGLDQDTSPGRLAALFDAHHYTRGLEFTPPGTPTNITPGVPRPAGDPGFARSFLNERGPALFTPGSGANGEVVATALGTPFTTFSHVAHAGDDDQVGARQMHAALWPATVGYFLSQRMFGLLNDDEIGRARRHFIDFVRAVGPLPTMRIGKQPYGVLPVTSLDRWQPLDAADAGARTIEALRALREAYRRAVANVPRMRQPTPTGPDAGRDPDQDLVAVLRMQPTSLSYSLRNVFGPYFVDNFWSFAGPGIPSTWWNGQQQLARLTGFISGMPLTTPQTTAVFAPWTDPLEGPLVQADRTNPQLQPNYIATLATATSQVLRNGPIPNTQVRPLLYGLLRHALLSSYSFISGSLVQRYGVPTDRQESELIDITTPDTPTIWRRLARPIGVFSGLPTIGQFMDDPANAGNPDLAPLTEVRTSLQALAQRSVPALEQLLVATLDACSYRLDAWLTSLATRRLAGLRARSGGAGFVGGYGWLENVRPAAARPSDGYVHAPSLSQATAAAVLVSAHLSHRGTGAASPFALDLSSERMRVARTLIDAVRQGQPLAALLGYRLERGLHQLNLDEYIDDLRAAAPLASTPSAPTTTPTESIAASNVVHGLDILEKWRHDEAPFPALRSASLAKFLQMDAEFRVLDDQVDALGDLLVAESVYQATRGQFDRASATLDSVARGESLPVPEVLDTPRTGLGLTHRLIAMFTTLTATSGWVGQPRGTAEPFLNSWAAQLLGNTVRVRFRATYIDAKTGTPVPGVAVREVRLPDLRLCPLDMVYVASARSEAERGELEQRLRLFVLQTRPANVPPDADVRLDYSRAANWPLNTIISLGEFLETVQAVRRLLTSARALGADDVALAEESPQSGVQIAELRGRATVAITALRLVQTDMRTLLQSPTPADLTALRAVLLRAAHFGIYSAVPVSATGDTPEIRSALLEQARTVDGDLAPRLTALDALLPLPATADLTTQRDREIERLKLVFGRDFLVLPRFKAANPTVLTQAFGASSGLQGGNAAEAFTWLNRAARVREGVARLLEVQRYGDALENGSATLTVAQLPFTAGDRWVALPPTPDKPLQPGRLSLVTCAPLPVDLSQPLVGVVIDEWNEVVPSARETTGVVFNFDEPDARAPHAILVAVAPDTNQPWGLESLEATLLETLDLASLRLVDPDAMLELDHYLPALYFAVNATDEAVSTNFRQPPP